MRDFVDALERQLLEASRREELRAQGLPRSASQRTTRGRTVGLVLATLLAGLVVVSLQAGSSTDKAQALPVLSRPATDASGVSIAAQLQRAGADLRLARAIRTPEGTSYVIPTSDGACLALADPAGGYGQSCASNEEIADRGLPLAMVPPVSGGTNAEFAVVLPAGANEVTVHSPSGEDETLPVADGVTSATVPQGASIAYTINGATQRITIPASAPGNAPQVGCDGPQGHYLITGRGSDPSDCG